MKNNKIKLIIFDAYGVVLTGGYKNTCDKLGKMLNRDSRELHDVIYCKYFNMAALRKITQVEAWKLAVKELELPIDWREVRKIHYSLMGKNIRVLKEVEKLKGKSKVMLLSKNTRSQFLDAEKLLNYQKVFDYVLNTWELKLPKASRETMMYILKKFKLKPDEVIYIDDQKENLIEAEKIGINTILFKNYKDYKNKIYKLFN